MKSSPALEMDMLADVIDRFRPDISWSDGLLLLQCTGGGLYTIDMSNMDSFCHDVWKFWRDYHDDGV
jgi:hypothetical protein